MVVLLLEKQLQRMANVDAKIKSRLGNRVYMVLPPLQERTRELVERRLEQEIKDHLVDKSAIKLAVQKLHKEQLYGPNRTVDALRLAADIAFRDSKARFGVDNASVLATLKRNYQSVS